MKPKMASEQARQAIVGLDVAKAKLDVALRLPAGKWRTKVVPNSLAGFEQLREWLAKHGVSCAHVCMEATGVYWEAVASDLADHGFAVSVMNPSQQDGDGRLQGHRRVLCGSGADPVAACQQERAQVACARGQESGSHESARPRAEPARSCGH